LECRPVRRTAKQAFHRPGIRLPRYLLRDRDAIYGVAVRQTLARMGIEAVVIAPRSPWQSPYVERFLGSLCRECLNHVIVRNERHRHRIVSDYLAYYHHARPRLSLDRNAPVRDGIFGRHRS
jgi:transposase InsO family protein